MASPRSARSAALAWSVLLYAAVLFFGVVFFFGLHYAGNRIPYDLALEKITTEIESDQRDLGYASSMSGDFEYCQRAATVLGVAKRLEGDNPIVDAVLPRHIVDYRAEDYCESIELLSGNENVYKGNLKFRYWWGSTPLYAIALRFLSDADIREWTRILTIFAWGLLSLVLGFLSRRAFLVVAPLAALASFFSGILLRRGDRHAVSVDAALRRRARVRNASPSDRAGDPVVLFRHWNGVVLPMAIGRPQRFAHSLDRACDIFWKRLFRRMSAGGNRRAPYRVVRRRVRAVLRSRPIGQSRLLRMGKRLGFILLIRFVRPDSRVRRPVHQHP